MKLFTNEKLKGIDAPQDDFHKVTNITWIKQNEKRK